MALKAKRVSAGRYGGKTKCGMPLDFFRADSLHTDWTLHHSRLTCPPIWTGRNRAIAQRWTRPGNGATPFSDGDGKLPFITDHSWKPETYRLAKRAWELNAPGTDGKIQGRKAQKSDKPKHAGLSRKLRALMTWRAMMAGSDWTLMADNDDNGRTITMNADCIMEIRPLPSEIMAAIKRADIEIIERRHAKLGGGGEVVRLVAGNDVERGKVWRQGKGKPDCIVRIGSLRFSNGDNTERAPVLDVTGRPKMGDVRLPLGAMIKVGPHRLRDYFRHPKGASDSANDNNPTVRPSLTARAHAIDFTDPLSYAQERERIRKSVGKDTAKLLDHALIASTFEELGERLGYCGKTAERRGKAALIAACQTLERELAA